MSDCNRNSGAALACVILLLAALGSAHAQEAWRFILPEQRQMAIRAPSQMPVARLPVVPVPTTASDFPPGKPEWRLSLDETIRIALANSEVVRVLAGTGAASSGSTIYDPAIVNSGIDQARGRFDPNVGVGNDFNRRHAPQAGVDPADPTRVIIGGDPTYDYRMSTDLSKTTRTGGTARMGVTTNPSKTLTEGLPLNPQSPYSLEMGYTQPLLQGGWRRANMAPILIARIDTERSFFQLKGSVQRLVLGVIEGYWALVFARTDLWARQQQVKQGEESYNLAEANRVTGRRSAADVYQAGSALANFRASLKAAEANVLQREAALRDILGLPPSDQVQIVPNTPPTDKRLPIQWETVLRLAEENRPDLIELKLILEAEQQRLLMARNQAFPRVDATALYRWNGLEGWTPDGRRLGAGPGDYPGWTLGVNFSVPLGLRQARAELRQQELIIMRDRANLQQGLHSTTHTLATTYRSLSQYYEEYQKFKEARAASLKNQDVQVARYGRGLRDALYLNVLQAISSWGNAVSSEAQTLAQYNSELANLELQTGTILEAHGIRLFEERYGSIGPLGRLAYDRCYPRDMRPGPNADRYPTGTEPAENFFNLDEPLPARRKPSRPGTPSPPGPPTPPGSQLPTLPPPDRLRLEIPERIPVPPPGG